MNESMMAITPLNTVPIDAELPSSLLSRSDLQEPLSEGLSRREQRALAFHFLYVAEQSDYLDSFPIIVEMFRSHFELEIAPDSFALTMAQAVIEQRHELDEQLIPFLKNWKLDRLGCCTRLILRLALWELSLPDFIHNIVINEAIELAKGFAEKDAYRFINGILDEVVKSRQKLIPTI